MSYFSQEGRVLTAQLFSFPLHVYCLQTLPEQPSVSRTASSFQPPFSFILAIWLIFPLLPLTFTKLFTFMRITGPGLMFLFHVTPAALPISRPGEQLISACILSCERKWPLHMNSVARPVSSGCLCVCVCEFGGKHYFISTTDNHNP